MQLRTILVIGLSLVCGLSAAFFMVIFLKQQQQPSDPPPSQEMVEVIVATKDIGRFTTVTPEMIATRQVPRDLVPKGALTRTEDAIQRVALTSVAPNEILQDGKLAKKGSGQGMAAAIPPGMRAVTIKTAKISGVVGGLLSPSDRVDVLLAVTTADKELGAFTATLLNDIEVLAVGQATEASGDKMAASDVHSVSLLVTPNQDAKLKLAESKGTLHLSLRNPNDKQPAAEGKTTLEELGLMVGKLVPKQGLLPGNPLAETPKEVPAEIRTLRGVHEGLLILQSPPAAPPKVAQAGN